MLGCELPFASHFGVHQGTRVLTHNHLVINANSGALEL